MTEDRDLFEVDVSKTRLEIRFSSDLKQIDRVCTRTDAFLNTLPQIRKPHLFSIHLVIREGLTNAVRHGNKNDPEKAVYLSIDAASKRHLRLTIKDEGDGFDWRNVTAKSVDEAVESGRGIPIMEAYFTRYGYNRKGNVLYLEKDI